MKYLSDEWLDAANEAIAPMEPVADVSIGFDVSGGDDSANESYALELGPDRVRYRRDLSSVEVTLRLDRATAVAIARGELSAQRAFLAGDLRVAGDVRVLLGHTKAMAAVDDHLAAVRAATIFT